MSGILRNQCPVSAGPRSFALSADEVEDTRFAYSYSVYQVEYRRNLIIANGAELDDLFGIMADRIRSRIDVPVLRTLFGVKKRPRPKSWGKVLKPREAVVIETPSGTSPSSRSTSGS